MDQSAFRDRLASRFDASVLDVTRLSGGYVGEVFRVTLKGREPFAVKVGDTSLGLEARMLRYLQRNAPVPVPAVYHAEDDLLVLAFVEGDGQWTEATARNLAERVAGLHDVTSQSYGFPFETLSGPYRLPNPWTDAWIPFFREHRLEHFAERAHEEGALPTATRRRVRALARSLNDRLVEPERPSLLHGDLWTGNLIVRDEEVRAMLDPAVSFGHHEFEVAYIESSLDHGSAFVERYRAVRGLDDGYERRRDVYDVFHALEAVRFFGADRLAELRDALSRVGV